MGTPTSSAGSWRSTTPTLADRLAFIQNRAGAVPSPFDCYLVLRGVKTLAVRMDRHCQNARAVAAMLAEHPAVARVLYPGLPNHPGNAVAVRQMRDFGGMVSFIAAGGEEAARRIVEHTQLFFLAESLGGVESLIGHSASMSHSASVGTATAVDPALVRVSVGLETTEDLLADLRQALDWERRSLPNLGERARPSANLERPRGPARTLAAIWVASATWRQWLSYWSAATSSGNASARAVWEWCIAPTTGSSIATSR